MTHYIPLRLDLRGSINLPAQIKRELNLTIGGEVLVRHVGGVVIVVPMGGEGGAAFSDGRLDAWVSAQLKQDVPSGSLQVGKTAVAANIKLLAARERFEQEKILLELRLRVSQEERASKRLARFEPSPTPVDPAHHSARDILAELQAARESRAADSDRQLEEAVQQASTDLAGDRPSFPQA